MSDATASGFGKFVPGFDFLQNLASQAAGGVAQGLGNSLPQLPNLSHWVAPTFNVEELDKRIEELKAVHFWLDQNAKALGATIQALEVQKMTLATLQNMNFSLGDVANALKIKAADTVSGLTGKTAFAGLEIPPRTYGQPAAPDDAADPGEAAAPVTEPTPQPAKAARKPRAAQAAPAQPAGGVVDPVQWWGALTQQFQAIAANAMKDVAKQTALDTTRSVASGLTEQAVKTATGMAGKAADTVARNVGSAVGMGQAAVRAVGQATRKPRAAPVAKAAPARRAPGAKASVPKKTTGRKAAASKAARSSADAKGTVPTQPLSPGEWTLPAAFFPGLQAATDPTAGNGKPRGAAPVRGGSRRR